MRKQQKQSTRVKYYSSQFVLSPEHRHRLVKHHHLTNQFPAGCNLPLLSKVFRTALSAVIPRRQSLSSAPPLLWEFQINRVVDEETRLVFSLLGVRNLGACLQKRLQFSRRLAAEAGHLGDLLFCCQSNPLNRAEFFQQCSLAALADVRKL